MTNKPMFLTAEARTKLEAELEDLQNNKRPEITKRIAAAKEMGDLSENFEYHAARNEQGFIVGRIREIEQILRNAQLIEAEEGAISGVVRLGSTVKVRDEDGDEETYQIRGTVEANPRERIVSNESPIGQALLGKKAGDSVTVQSPAGSYKLKIVQVS
jgi:transcription elongation factor GreA